MQTGARRVALHPAFLLKTQPYRDTSLLIEAWTPEHGRVGLVARGARGPKSKTRALLQMLQPLLLSWTESGDLGSLTGVESAGLPAVLEGEAIFSAWYLNELLLRLLQRHDPHPQLYLAYVQALQALPYALEPALRRFESCLLTELGYGLDLPDDLDPAASYRFNADEGLQAELPGAIGAFSGATFIALRDERFDEPATLREMRRLLRGQLQPLLGARELESARLLRALRARGGASAA